jgi:hypothetical protein
MLDPRVYRAALLPALLAVIIAGFSLTDQGRGATTTLAPDAFDGARAFARLQALAQSFPSRRPGSHGDEALGRQVAREMRAAGLAVRRRSVDARTVGGDKTLTTVIGTRTGLSDRRIVVLAHRDAITRPATARLSGTAALLELIRVFAGRRPQKTLVFVSTSGGSAGGAGAADFAAHPGGPVDAVLVLGDVASKRVRRPMVVPWSNSVAVAPVVLRKTVEGALRTESGHAPGQPRGLAQFARLAFPFTRGEQGEVQRKGLPAVLVQVSGERGPGAKTGVSEDRMRDVGRAVLRSISALDALDERIDRPQAYLLLSSKSVPGWAVRLLVLALIVPVLLLAVDGYARARRRRMRPGAWAGWTLAGALPFFLAYLFILALELTGLLVSAPRAPAPADATPFDGGALAGSAAVVLVFVAGWAGIRPALIRRLRPGGNPSAPDAGVGVLLVLALTLLVIWLANPFLAALLVPAAHLWLPVLAPDVRLRRGLALLVVTATVVPLALVVIATAGGGASILRLPWTLLILLAGGHVGFVASLRWCLMLGTLASVLAVVRAKRSIEGDEEVPRTRGPATYAGPGSLGGTESALGR